MASPDRARRDSPVVTTTGFARRPRPARSQAPPRTRGRGTNHLVPSHTRAGTVHLGFARLADPADKSNDAAGGNGSEAKKAKPELPDPPGYFQGESMTRRKVFTVASQA